MQSADTERSRRWTRLAATVVLLALITLGFWQLERAAEKQRLQDLYNARAELSPKGPEHLTQRPESLDHFRISVTGQYDQRYQILLDNKVHQGQAGYHVLTPLLLEHGVSAVLVNRGWVPWGPSREKLPEALAPAGEVVVAGRLRVPSAVGFTLGSSASSTNGWQVLWQSLDLKRYQGLAPFEVYPVIIRLNPDSEAGGFVRDWPDYSDSWVARHRGYAFQWFALALALVIVLVALNLRRNE